MVRAWEFTKRKQYSEFKKDDALDADNDTKNVLPFHLGAFNLSNSRTIMNSFNREINGFYNINIYYGDTDSFYIEK